MKNRQVVIIIILTLISTVWVHWNNHVSLLESSGTALNMGVSVATQDDPSYLAPVENGLVGKGWRSNAVGKAAYVTRTPGYGLIYAAFRAWLPQKTALTCLLLFQFLLFALSAATVFALVKIILKDEKWALLVAICYGVLPMFSGFLSYTLTEGVTPAFVIFFLYFFTAYSAQRRNYLWYAAIMLSLLIIIRPAMIVWILVFPLKLWSEHIPALRKQMLLAFCISVLPLVVWQIVAYQNTDELPGLHAIYHDDANDLYRPVHAELWNLHKSWGQEGHVFHSDIQGIWKAALVGKSPRQAIDKTMAHLPEGVNESIDKSRFEWIYQAYYEVLSDQKPYFDRGEAMPGETKQEIILRDSIQIVTKAFRSHNWLETWVLVPVKVYGRLAAHSNLSLYVFQKTWRGNLFVEALRWLSFCIHLGVFILFPVALLLNFKNPLIRLIAFPIAFYLAYLCFVQRGVEERYTLPVLLPMLVCVAVFLHFILKQFISKNEKAN